MHTLLQSICPDQQLILYILTAFSPTYPQRQDIIEKYGNRWTEPGHLVSNGPFILQHWQHEYKIELIANEHYLLEFLY